MSRLAEDVAAVTPARPGPARNRVVAVMLGIALLVEIGASFAHQPRAGSGDSAPAVAAPMGAMPPSTATGSGPEAATGAPVSSAATDLSVAVLIRRADPVVQLVMALLGFASVACWSVFLGKLLRLSRARRRLTAELSTVGNARFLRDDVVAEGAHGAGPRASLMGRLIDAAIGEWRLSGELIANNAAVERYILRAGEIVRGEARGIAAGSGLLATIGATAPFVGLFGTVWGIMNSFIGISRAQSTNLAIVAPGIAEALLATAMGLVAAIPAVIFYNLLARATKAYVDQAGEASGLVVRLLSRELDRRPPGFAAHAAE